MAYMNDTTGKTTITDEIYNQIFKKISNGTYAGGEKLPSEKELCELHKASRTSVRNALQRLEAMGLICTYKGKGSFVSGNKLNKTADTTDLQRRVTINENGELSMEDYAEFWQFRQALGDKAVEQFVQYADEEDIMFLMKCVDGMIDAENFDELSQRTMDFHMYIYKHCRNRYIVEAFEHNADILKASFRTIQHKYQSKAILVRWHEQYIDNIRKKDVSSINMKIAKENVLFLHGICNNES